MSVRASEPAGSALGDERSVAPRHLDQLRPFRRLAAVIEQARRRQRRRRLVLAVVAGAIVATAGVHLVWQGGGGVPESTKVGLDVRSFRLGAAPIAVTLAAGDVWVVEETGGMRAELVRLDPRTGRRLATFAIGRSGPDIGAATSSGGIVWAAAGNHLIRVDASRPVAVQRLSVPGESAVIAVGAGSVWVASVGLEGSTLSRIDPATLSARTRIRLNFQPVSLAVGLGSLWIASTDGLWRLDPATAHLNPAAVPVVRPIRLALSGKTLWLVQRNGLLTEIDRAERARARIRLPFAPGSLVATSGRVWITDDCGCLTGRLALVNARTHRLLAERTIGETPVDIAAGPNGAWVATFGDRRISWVRPST